MSFVFLQKDKRVILRFSLILYKNNWDFKLLFYPFGYVGSQVGLKPRIKKHLIKTLHDYLIKEGLRINFFNELRFDFLGSRLKLADGKNKVR